MKKILVMLLLVSAIGMLGVSPTFAATNVALDGVEVALEETGGEHNLQDWGPIEPLTHGGGWGDAPWGDYSCRTVWGGDPPDNNWATVTMDGKGSARIIQINHLDGLADDSFDLHARRGEGEWIYIGHYTYSGNTAEFWVITDFDLYAAFSAADIGVGLGKPITVKITATAPAWGGQGTWGQLGIHEIVLIGNGQPGY